LTFDLSFTAAFVQRQRRQKGRSLGPGEKGHFK